MKNEYTEKDFSKAIKNPFAKKLKQQGKYQAIIEFEDYDEILQIDAETGKTLSSVKMEKHF